MFYNFGNTDYNNALFPQSSGGDEQNNKYNLMNINPNFGDFFKSDLNQVNEEKKKDEEK